MAESSRIILTPFFRPRDEDAEEQQMYMAGFVDEQGETWGTQVPLEAGLVEQAVMSHQTFGVWCNSDGRIHPQPRSDGLFEHLLEKGQLEETPIDELVADAIEEGRNEPDDEILDMLQILHKRLVRAASAVADEISRRRR